MSTSILRNARIAVLALTLVMAISGCGKEESASVATDYDFTLTDLGGESVSFSDFKNTVIMVNFWAPWCGPCRAETPDLIDLYNEYEKRGLKILGVAVGYRSEQSVHDFAQQVGISYPVLLGNNDLVKQYGGFQGIPTTFLFSRDGRLHKKYVGTRPRETFEMDILELL
jgi:thiol-disulfide isomerase/thioredoxin